MELIKLGDKTYYIKNNTNIGVYKLNDTDIVLIDSGLDESVSRKILRIINDNNWNIKYIINTHSHADHTGGNNFLQSRTNCKIYASEIECDITNHPIIEPIYLYGSYPFKELRNKFFEAKPSNCEKLVDIDGLEYFTLTGHSFDMIGIKTSDNVYFIGDSLFDENTINKYHISYLNNVSEFINSLDKLSEINGLFVPSHGEVSDDIHSLIKLNKDKTNEILNKILLICKDSITLEDIVKDLLSGISIVFDNEYAVGDLVKINDFTGTVVSLGLRTTKIRAYTGETLIISNSTINEVINYSLSTPRLVIDINVSYDTDINKLEKVLTNMKEEVKKFEEHSGELELLGVSSLDSSLVVYQVTILSKPGSQFALKKKLLKLIKETLDKNNIEIPYNKLDVKVRK